MKNKDIRTTPVAYFTPGSSVSFVNIEYVIDGRVCLKSIFLVVMKCIAGCTTAPKRMFTAFESCLSFINLLTLQNRVQFSKCKDINMAAQVCSIYAGLYFLILRYIAETVLATNLYIFKIQILLRHSIIPCAIFCTLHFAEKHKGFL